MKVPSMNIDLAADKIDNIIVQMLQINTLFRLSHHLCAHIFCKTNCRE